LLGEQIDIASQVTVCQLRWQSRLEQSFLPTLTSQQLGPHQLRDTYPKCLSLRVEHARDVFLVLVTAGQLVVDQFFNFLNQATERMKLVCQPTDVLSLTETRGFPRRLPSRP